MVRLLIRALVFVGSAAIGLLTAVLVLDDVSATRQGFVLVSIIFAVIQTVISPFIARVAAKNASALLGGIGLIATGVALVAVTWLGDALTIEGGLSTWLSATVIVWFATAIATLLLPLLIALVARRRRAGHAPGTGAVSPAAPAHGAGAAPRTGSDPAADAPPSER